MEDIQKVNFNYSLKDIPICNKKEYLIKLYDATSKFINRLRWKLFFCNQEDNSPYEYKEENIFKSRKSAPAHDELKAFENDLFNIIKNIKFTTYKSNFQKKLKHDLNSLLTKNKIILFADKTRNLYQTTPKFYKKLITNSITKTYKISDENLINQINSESESIIRERKYKNKKIPKFTATDAFLTIKDHKKHFPFNIECRVLNPAKNELGRISKTILEKAVRDIRAKTPLTQWKNSHDVIVWFENIKQKNKKCFLTFDIINFYPSIKHQHLIQAINFAKEYTDIEEKDIRLIEHTCKTILTYNNKIWIKKDVNTLFDVPMGSFFGAELCDLVGLYILNRLKSIYNTNEIGLYRDDGLAIIERKNNQSLENIKKKTIKLFSDIGFKITIDVGSTICNFLDTTLDMTNNLYKPYRKENSEVRYINNKSNHPKIIKKNLPAMIERRINKLSKNEQIFNNSITVYQKALDNANFKHKLKYTENKKTQTKKKTNRQRKIIYFNPPFCQSVKTNIGKAFFEITNKYCKQSEILGKILNKNSCKISYSCMGNIKVIIQKHNKKVLCKTNKSEEEKSHSNSTSLCNCRSKNLCPLDNKCLIKNVIYKATISSANETKNYIGSTGNTFKNRWYNHNNSFKNYKENGTELAKYVWHLKNSNINYNIKWNILHHIGEIRNIHNICKTCVLEKIEIANAKKNTNLNKRYELFANCPHFQKLCFKT